MAGPELDKLVPGDDPHSMRLAFPKAGNKDYSHHGKQRRYWSTAAQRLPGQRPGGFARSPGAPQKFRGARQAERPIPGETLALPCHRFMPEKLSTDPAVLIYELSLVLRENARSIGY